ncbi:MAG: carbon-nitrogen hydrolase family protein [Abitibacteriaceae bacterium]|nr:carbon-nitrogen hydrolase family protein [Abditibacteriaceae bacterium]
MPVVARFHDFAPLTSTEHRPDGWTTWSPRPEIAPHFAINPTGGLHGHGALEMGGNNNAAAYGSWRRRIEGIVGGRTYHFIAYYHTKNVAYPRRCVSAQLDWLDEKDQRVSPPDYALDISKSGDWTKMEYVVPAPPAARAVVIDLSFGWSPKGTVLWDDIQLLEEPSPPHRTVRAVTIYHRPRDTKSAAASVEEFCRLIEESAAQRPDIICLPEGMTVVGTGKTYEEVSEPVPGPTTQKLGALARKLHTYIVAGLYERVGATIYNTAVLIGRQGEVVGTYRKTHLPREEVEAGLSPGDAYPVFNTDFGKVGLLICWDVQFPEPARALALKGAEVILLPIWGGNEVLARARAIENHVYLVTSSYDMKTFIVDPTGEVLSEATPEHAIAVAELPLDKVIEQPWLGNMKTRTWKERRPDIPLP